MLGRAARAIRRSQLLRVLPAIVTAAASTTCGVTMGYWFRTDTDTLAPYDDVKRDWNACADVVDIKYGGFGLTRNAEVLSVPWVETRECMVQEKGYYHVTPGCSGKGTRYPPAPGADPAETGNVPLPRYRDTGYQVEPRPADRRKR